MQQNLQLYNPEVNRKTKWIQITHFFLEMHKCTAPLGNIHSVLCNVLGYAIPKSCVVLYIGHLDGSWACRPISGKNYPGGWEEGHY